MQIWLRVRASDVSTWWGVVNCVGEVTGRIGGGMRSIRTARRRRRCRVRQLAAWRAAAPGGLVRLTPAAHRRLAAHDLRAGSGYSGPSPPKSNPACGRPPQRLDRPSKIGRRGPTATAQPLCSQSLGHRLRPHRPEHFRNRYHPASRTQPAGTNWHCLTCCRVRRPKNMLGIAKWPSASLRRLDLWS